MTTCSRSHSKRLIPMAAGALGLVLLAFPAMAQDQDNANSQYVTAQGYGPDGAREHVQIVVPRARPPIIIRREPTGRTSYDGIPLENVSMSQGVPYGDLDLSTRSGAYAFKERIRYTARLLCKRMDFAYPLKTSDSPPCYRSAVADAMGQADQVIGDASAYQN